MNLIEIERRRESRSRIVVVVARYVRAQANACSRTRAARTAFTPPTGSPFAAQYSFNSAAVSVSSSPLSANPFTSVAANPAAAASRPPPIPAAGAASSSSAARPPRPAPQRGDLLVVPRAVHRVLERAHVVRHAVDLQQRRRVRRRRLVQSLLRLRVPRLIQRLELERAVVPRERRVRDV